MQIVIIGAGASGMAAAIAAKEQDPAAEVLVLEKQARAGKKLLATGNGRCNLTNRNMDASFYHGTGKALAAGVLERFNENDVLSFFERMGLLTVTEPSGRVYPFSDRANSVLDVLRMRMEALGVELCCDFAVTSIRKKKERFCLDIEKRDAVCADRVIIACGGAASPKLGGGNDGYTLLESFGHERTKLYPSLVRLITEPELPRSCKGIRADAEIRILSGRHCIAQSAGEIQFTENGISGPAAFEVSRAAAANRKADAVVLDLCRILSAEELETYIRKRAEGSPELSCGMLFTGLFHSRVGQMAVKAAGYSPETPCGSADARHIAETVKSLVLPLRGTAGLPDAQVTAGGISAEGFSENLESVLCKGLFAAGEVLDVDGDCGGYNLQWAWASGVIAGREAVR